MPIKNCQQTAVHKGLETSFGRKFHGFRAGSSQCRSHSNQSANPLANSLATTSANSLVSPSARSLANPWIRSGSSQAERWLENMPLELRTIWVASSGHPPDPIPARCYVCGRDCLGFKFWARPANPETLPTGGKLRPSPLAKTSGAIFVPLLLPLKLLRSDRCGRNDCIRKSVRQSTAASSTVASSR